MSLSILASLGSFVSGFAVLVSLIFLYFQLGHLNRQAELAEKNQEAQIRQARAERTVDLILARLDPSITLAIRKGFNGAEDMTELELEQFSTYQRAAFFSWQETYEQRRAGHMGDDEFADFTANIRALCATPGLRIVWRTQLRIPLGRDFTQWMEQQMKDQPLMPPPDRLGEWKEAAAAMRAGA